MALSAAATVALLLGGVGPAFAVTDEDSGAGIEATIEDPTELEIVTDEAPADEAPGDSSEDVIFTDVSGASEKPSNPGVSTSATGGAAPSWSQPRRKISGQVALPQGADASWMANVSVGADCYVGPSEGPCGYDISFNKKTGAFSMMVPVARSGMTIEPGAYVSDSTKNTQVNLVQQHWGQTCGVGTPKATPAGKGHLTGVTLPMCFGATVTGTVSDPQHVAVGVHEKQNLYAYTGRTTERVKALTTTAQDGTFTLRRVPIVDDLLVVLDSGIPGADQAWNGTYDLKQATPIDTTSGSVTGIDFTVKPGFADMCMMYDYCNKFYKEVMWMLETGISTGTKVDVGWSVWYNYHPKQNVTREAMAAFLYRMSDRTGYKAPKKQLFPDVKPNHKFYKQIQWMGATGISTGTKRNGKSYYEPSKSVTRDAMAAFLYRMSDRSGYVPPTKQAFPDVKPGHKFYTQIQWMSKAGISTGTKRNGKYYYDPSTAVSREAMAAFLYRFNN
ncbi:S-layer homology domain-containing protein [Leucobacter sp. HY1908]